MDRGKKLLRGSAAKALNFFVMIATSFFMMPFLVRSLGDDKYGLWTLVGSFLGYFGLMDIGLSSAVVRFISRAVGRKDDDDVRKTIATSFYLFLGLGLITALVTVGAVFFLGFFFKTKHDVHIMQVLLLLLGLNFAVDFPVRSFNAVFTSNLREDIGTGIMIVKNLLCAVAIYFVIKAGYGILGLAVTSVAFSLADSAVRVILAFRVEPRTTINRKFLDKSRLKPMFNYSFPTMVGRFSSILCFRLDQIVITTFVSLGAVTHYAVGFRLIEYISSLMGQTTGVVTPLFSQDEGMNDFTSIRRKFILLSRATIYIAVFCGGMVLMYGRPFIRRWMGDGYNDSANVMMIFLIPFTLDLIQSSVTPLLYGISKHSFYVYTNLVEGFVNLGLSLLLGRRYGMYGVAIGTAIPMTFKLLFIQPWYACRVIDLPAREYAWILVKHSARAALAVAAARPLLQHIEILGYPGFFIAGVVHVALFVPLALFFAFEPADRERVMSLALSTVGFRKKPLANAA